MASRRSPCFGRPKPFREDEALSAAEDRGASVRFSVVIGVLGGLVDLAAGLVLLVGPMGPSAMAADWTAVGLLALGVVVLATVTALARAPMGRAPTGYRGLMLAYGILMLIIGGVMLTGLLPMMEGSLISGGAMVLVGIGMLFSGATMARM